MPLDVISSLCLHIIFSDAASFRLLVSIADNFPFCFPVLIAFLVLLKILRSVAAARDHTYDTLSPASVLLSASQPNSCVQLADTCKLSVPVAIATSLSDSQTLVTSMSVHICYGLLARICNTAPLSSSNGGGNTFIAKPATLLAPFQVMLLTVASSANRSHLHLCCTSCSTATVHHEC